MTRLILQSGDPAPFNIDNKRSNSRYVVVCDHATNVIPIKLDNLGLSSSDLSSHIAWDIGAQEIAQRVAHKLDAVLISSGYSRLVIDCNRYPRDRTSILEVSDRIPIPGNVSLSSEEAYARRSEIFEPYHSEIEARIVERLDAGLTPVLISIHSMTEELNGIAREWPISIQSHDDKRVSAAVLANLRASNTFPIGDNEPYKLEANDYTIFEHAAYRGFPHIQVEFRQDWVTNDAGVEQLSAAFCNAIVPVLESPTTRHPICVRGQS